MSLILTIDIIEHFIMLFLDYDSIINYGRTWKRGERLCRRRYFWQQKATHDFDVSSPFFNNTFLSPAHRYLQILTYHGGIAQGSDRFLFSTESTPTERFIIRAIRLDRDELIDPSIENPMFNLIQTQYVVQGRLDKLRLDKIEPKQLSILLHHAIIHDHLIIVKELFGRDCFIIADESFYLAVRYGYIEMVEFLLPHISEIYPNILIINAIKSKRLDLVKLAMNYGPIDWDEVFPAVLKTGDIDIFCHIYLSLSDDRLMFWEEMYFFAYASGSYQFIYFVHELIRLDNRPQLFVDPQNELRYAVESSSSSIVKFVLDNYPTYNFDFDFFYDSIEMPKNLEILKILLTRQQPTLTEWQFMFSKMLTLDNPLAFVKIIPVNVLLLIQDGLTYAINAEGTFSLLVVKYLKDQGVKLEIQWDNFTEMILATQNKQLIDLMMEFKIEGILEKAIKYPRVYEYLSGR